MNTSQYEQCEILDLHLTRSPSEAWVYKIKNKKFGREATFCGIFAESKELTVYLGVCCHMFTNILLVLLFDNSKYLKIVFVK